MRRALIGLCIFAAACSSQTTSPTSPSGVAGAAAQTQARGGAPVEVTFTKWVTAYPAMGGVTGGDVPGTFVGEVLNRHPFANGTIVQLEALYGAIADDPARSFAATVEGKQNNTTQEAVLNGTVTSGWLLGAQVHATYEIIVPATGTSCVPAAPVNSICFQGTIRILPGTAD
jgi:hypothetical protein